jgi:predicted dehydrogenase
VQKKTSRRDFLRVAATSTLAAGMAPAMVGAKPGETLRPAPVRPVSPNDRIRFATIGMGIMGLGDSQLSVRIPGTEFVAAADLYDGRLVHTKEVFGNNVETTRDYRELIARDDIDAIIIATTDHWHVPMAIEALEAGKDVYLEKPAVHTIEEGPRLLSAAEKSGKILQVGSQRVSSVVYAKARELYQAGAIGQLNMIEARYNRNSALGAWQYTIPLDASPETVDWDRFLGSAPQRPFDPVRFFRWRNYWDYGTGVGGDLFVHLFSGIHFVLDSNGPTRVMSTGGLRYWKDGRDSPDVLMGLYDYPERDSHPPFTMALQVNFADGSGGEESFRFIGNEGTMTIGWGGVTVNRLAPALPSEDEVFRGWNSVRTFSNAQQGELLREFRAKRQQEPAPPPDPFGPEIVFRTPQGYNDQYDHFRVFYEAMRSREPVVEDAVFGYRAAAPALLSNMSYIDNRIYGWDPEAMRLVS